MSLLIYRKLGKLRRSSRFCLLCGLFCPLGLTTVVSTLSKTEGHLGEGEDEQDRDAVDHIEEDDLSKEELVACLLIFSTFHSILTEVCVMGDNISHEPVNSVKSSDVVKLEKEDSTHGGGDNDDECPKPLDSVEDTYEEEGSVVHAVVLGEPVLLLGIAHIEICL